MSLKTDKQILDALKKKPQSARELFRVLRLGSVTLDRALRNLEKLGVIERTDEKYRVAD